MQGLRLSLVFGLLGLLTADSAAAQETTNCSTLASDTRFVDLAGNAVDPETDKEPDQRLAEIRQQPGSKKPNSVYILIDDMGFGEFGIPELNRIRGGRTPNLDGLAKEGVAKQGNTSAG